MPIISMNDENFAQTLTDNPVTVVKYYADWCGSCRLIAPKFKRWAESSPQGVAFAETNAESNPEARKAAGVDNLPFFAVFKDGKLVSGAATSKIEAVQEMLNAVVGS